MQSLTMTNDYHAYMMEMQTKQNKYDIWPAGHSLRMTDKAYTYVSRL